MNIQKIKVESLNPAEYNPRKDLKLGDKEYEKLKRSIAEFGYVEPVVWNKTTGNVVGGHQRLKVLVDLDQTEIDCVVVELDPQKEKALNLALNKIQGEWDETKLAELMADLDASAFDVELTGFDPAEIDALLSPKGAVEDKFDSEKAKKEIEESGAVTQRGDIWLLGNHRLMCGDSTSAEDFARLMDGQHAQLCVTSPPYGVGKDYEQKGLEPWFGTMKPAIKNICKNADVVCYNIGDLFTTGSQFMEPTFAHSIQMFSDCGFRPLWIRIWDKFRKALSSSSPYHLSTLKPVGDGEYIGAFAANEEQDAEIDASEYSFISAFAGYGYRFVKRLSKQERREWGYSMLWRFPSVTGTSRPKDVHDERNHKARFPVELPWRCIRMHSDKDNIVLEPFSGSGTTIIACEQTERRCYAMELSPIYCDIAVRRWEEFTGEKAVRLEAGL